jgi:phage I-like protein
MTQQFGYWTDLSTVSAVKLADSENMVSTIMAMPYGEYVHPTYGKLRLTAEKAQRMAQNIANKVRGTDLDIDYDHKAKDGRAAGWIRGAEVRNNGLYVTVEWTKKAWRSIKAGEYKYFSPEYHDQWQHPQTQVVHKDVLFGGGITNRPFLKDILPINMSELFAEQTQEAGMDPKKRRLLLGLPEDATDEQCEAAEDARLKELETDDKTDDKDGKGAPVVTEPVAAGEQLPPEVIQLSESNPAIKALVDGYAALNQQVNIQGAALKLAEVQNQVTKLAEPKDGYALSAGSQELLQKALMEPSQATVVALVEALRAPTGRVQLGEANVRTTTGDGDGEDSTKKFNDAVAAKIDAAVKAGGKMDYGDAVSQVAAERPDLFESYRQGSYAFKEN